MNKRKKKRPDTVFKKAGVFFSQLDRLVTQTAEMDEIFGAYLRGIAGFLKAKRVSLMMLEEKSQQLFIRAAEGLRDEIKANTRIELGKGIAGWVALKGKGVLIRNIARHRKFSKEKKGKGFSSGSFISIPVKLRGKTYGVLNVAEKKDATPFSKKELETLKFFGIQLSVFLENQRLRKEIQDLAEKTVEELAEISHDFRMPLACAQEALRLVEEAEQEGDVTDARRQFLEIARRNLQRMMNIFDDLIRSVTGRGAWEDKIEEFDIKQVALELAEEFRMKAAGKGVTIGVEAAAEPVRVVSEETKVRGVMMNLIDNAVKYTREETAVTIRVSDVSGSHVRFEVWDRGPGIPAGEQARLFDKKANIQKCRERAGTGYEGHGLGLAISKEMITRLGGQIGAQSRPGEGAMFYFEIPHRKKSFHKPALNVS